MHFISRVFTALLLKLSLSVLIVSSTVLYLVGSPAVLKSSLKEANVYQDIVPAILETIDEDASSKQAAPVQQENSVFSDPAVREVVQASIEPAILQAQVDGAIDAFSSWLYGDTEKLQFVMDFQPIQQTLTRNLAAYAVSRVESLPACTAADAVDLNAAQDDVLSLQCRPDGISASAIEQKLSSELSDIDFTVNEQTFQDADEEPLESQLTDIKRSFGLLKIIVFVSLLLTLLSAGVYLLAHRPLKKALYGLGKSLLGSGLMVLVPALLTLIIAPKLLARAHDGQKALAEVGLSFASEYVTKVCVVLLIWGAALSFIGIVVMIVDRKVIGKREGSPS